MKITHILALIMVVIFLTAASCNVGRQATQTVESPFSGGIEGLTVELEEIGSVSDTGAKNEVWEDEAFPVDLRVMNKGEHSLNSHEVEFEIKGISPHDFTGLSFNEDNDNKIEGVSEFLPEGGIDYVSFGDAQYVALTGTHYDANFFVYYTYPYKTHINIPKVCYKENIRDTTVCDVDSTKQAFSSGGPIQVGTVTEKYIGKGKILLEIPITNVAQGRIKAYNNDEFEPNFDEISFQINQPNWICTSRGNNNVARISHPTGQPGNEEVIIRCINDNLEEGALYQKSITMELSYYYKDWVEQTVRIRENPE
jgi:hypothetical protein